MTLKESELHTILSTVDLLDEKIEEDGTSIIERVYLRDIRNKLGTITCYPLKEGGLACST